MSRREAKLINKIKLKTNILHRSSILKTLIKLNIQLLKAALLILVPHDLVITQPEVRMMMDFLLIKAVHGKNKCLNCCIPRIK